MSLRRFGPLLGALAVGLVALLARLWDVQVTEYAIWRTEAAGLVRSWTVEPYRRGTIRDRRGRWLVRDEEVYELEFVWRDFRRGHPLGQVAQLRSLLSMRPVSLQEAREELVGWGQAAVRLSPAAIDAFGRGEAIRVGDHLVPAVLPREGQSPSEAARQERRRARAADLHFYAKALLGLDRRQLRRLERLRKTKQGRDSAYLDLAVQAIDAAEVSAEDLRRDLEGRLQGSLTDLARLAALVDWGALAKRHGDALAYLGGARPLDGIVALIEAKRREVESGVADELFRRAAGFDPSRLDRANLSRLDLDWLRRCLHWDGERLAEWRAARGAAWPAVVEEHLAGHAIARAKLGREDPAERVLSSLAYFFHDPGQPRARRDSAVPVSWRRVDEVVVLSSLAAVARSAGLGADERAAAGLDGPALPFQREDLRRAPLEGRALLGQALATVPFPASPSPGDVDARSAGLEQLLADADPDLRAWSPAAQAAWGAALLHWDGLLQARVAALLDALGPEPVQLDDERIEAAVEERAYVVRDRSARAMSLDRSPDYALVYEVARHPERHVGFHVLTSTRRVTNPEARLERASEEPVLLAARLVGSVRSPYLVSLLEQRPQELELLDLQRRAERDEDEIARILDAVAATRRHGEAMGGDGLEAYFDHELRGRNGYRETVGLQARREGRAAAARDPVDGLDLTLTLDLDLQRAAQALIDDPGPPPPDEEKPDRAWARYPVGAIVLVTVDGAVLAAASGPSTTGDVGPGQDGERRHAVERTLTQVRFHPPGSVFKPFVAAWALDRGLLDPEGYVVTCAVHPGESTGSHREGAKVRCHGVHYEVRLERALLDSCNAFFASLGEDLDGKAFRELAGSFGFGRPTGVRSFDGGDRDAGLPLREGLREDWRADDLLSRTEDVPNPVMRQRLGNGLTHLSVTPMQVARAYCGLATGRLPEMRLVERIGDGPLPRAGEPLPIGAPALEMVRRALRRVAVDGTAANKGLDPATLGFTFACKTGSADYKEGSVPRSPAGPLSWRAEDWRGDGMRKHGWVAGWFPAEDPVAVAVVYVHDTSTTSSHVATHVMSRFLRTPAVQAWLEAAR